jgi:acyl-CoA synthetase (AMP-forming)/AMP-acid ligase II
VFDGCWNCPDETAATFRNAWHHTGDNGAFDSDGYLWYRGSSTAKELIKPGGENVYPVEVEAALKAHAAIAEAVVFGVPDKEWGESIKAVCVLRAGAVAVPDEISAFVASRIARYKRPKHLVLAADVPRLEDGRIDRAKTRALFSWRARRLRCRKREEGGSDVEGEPERERFRACFAGNAWRGRSDPSQSARPPQCRRRRDDRGDPDRIQRRAR